MYFVSNDENKAVQSIIEMAQIIEAIHREKLRPNIADDFELQGANAAAGLLTLFSWMFVYGYRRSRFCYNGLLPSFLFR